MNYRALADPHAIGVEIIGDFVGAAELSDVLAETQGPDGIEWIDAHETYQNQRGLTIVQNHFAHALKLSRGDQSPLELLPATVALYRRTERFIRSLSAIFPSLATWEADELSFHLYDDAEVGLSRHRDNSRFVGAVAIIAIDGECDLVVTHDDGNTAFAVKPGDLCILRAPGLIETDMEIRPEHSIENLKTETRLSMMLRANARPDEAIPGFRFNNWNADA